MHSATKNATPALQSQAEGFRKDMMALRQNLRERGFYKAPHLTYLRNVAELVLLFSGSLWLLSLGTWPAAVAGIFLLALYYPQSAWLGHDVAHGQIFESKRTSEALFPLMAWQQGLSALWWKEKHGKHHAHPNAYEMVDGKPVPMDRDIATVPWLIWDAKLLSSEQKTKYSGWMRIQSWFLGPMLLLARLNWSLAGILWGVRHKKYNEAAGIVFNYAGTLALAVWAFPGHWAVAVAWFLAAQLAGGFMLGFVFILNHSGMDVYEHGEEHNFFEAQVRSTRNVTATAFNTWFTGALNLQLEHHLFPNMPRHNLAKCRKEVQQTVEKHGYEYISVGMAEAAKIVWSRLPKEA